MARQHVRMRPEALTSSWAPSFTLMGKPKEGEVTVGHIAFFTATCGSPV